MTDATWPNIRYDFSGATVLVTGGTSGIGAGIAAAYRAAGADVAITGTRAGPDDYDDDLSGYRYFQLDVENNADIDRVAAAQDRLDILINNAGFALPSIGIDEYEPDNFERAVRMHLVSVFRMSAACAGRLAHSTLPGGASIVGIGSMSSFFGIDIVPGYGAGKSGLVGLTRTLAIHWAKDNIRVNAVAAGLTRSRMTAGTIAHPAWSAPTLARTPLNRLGEPADIAGPVLFLTSAAAGFITGQTLPVDGGYTVMG
jgi:NAD(P)-dependent dehydrogenase (short-subunit alcohol dehydrogenase family)